MTFAELIHNGEVRSTGLPGADATALVDALARVLAAQRTLEGERIVLDAVQAAVIRFRQKVNHGPHVLACTENCLGTH